MGTQEPDPPRPPDLEPNTPPTHETLANPPADPNPGTPAASDPRGPSRPGRSRRPDPRDSPTSTPRDFDAARVHPRDLDLHELAKLLRSVARLTPDRRSFGEWVAAYRRELPLVVPAVDVDAWIAWVLVGVPLFSTTLPTVKRTRDTATRVLLSIALARADGSLSAVARSLGSSRKVLRERMRRLGLYPWG